MGSGSWVRNGKYRPRYRDEHGREPARHVDRKVDAERWLDGVAAPCHRHLHGPGSGPAELRRVLRREVVPPGVGA